jgi:hypothetical protein
MTGFSCSSLSLQAALEAATLLLRTRVLSSTTSTGNFSAQLLPFIITVLIFVPSHYHIAFCRSRIDLLQREVSDLNAKLIAAASRGVDSAAEWAPYFQAAQRDHAQKLQVCGIGVIDYGTVAEVALVGAECDACRRFAASSRSQRSRARAVGARNRCSIGARKGALTIVLIWISFMRQLSKY